MALKIKTEPKEKMAVLDRSVAIPVMITVCIEVFKEFGHDATITENRGGRHTNKSTHYKSDGLDWRTLASGIDVSEAKKIGTEIKSRLGSQFEVVIHDSHIHTGFIGCQVAPI